MAGSRVTQIVGGPGATMRIRAAAVMLGAVLGGCMGAGDGPGPTGARTSDPVAAGREVSRAIWGVVPSAPRRKADLRPELIRGAAVAVAADTLLADCRATEGRTSVGLVRHNKYRIAKVTHGGAGQVCLLTVSEGPLNPAIGYRSFADLRVGEPVTALASRTSAKVVLAQGWLIGKGSDGDPFLEASFLVPASRSIVLVDGFGNLIGVGPAAPEADGVLLASPVTAAAGPFLARRDLESSTALQASLTASPRTQPVRQETIAILNEDDHGSERSPAAASVPAERQAAAADRKDKGGQGAGSPATGSSGPTRGEGSGGAAAAGASSGSGEGGTSPGAAAANGSGGPGAIGAGAGGEEGAERPQGRGGSGNRGRRGDGGDSSGRGSDDGPGDHGRGGDRGRRGGRGRD